MVVVYTLKLPLKAHATGECGGKEKRLAFGVFPTVTLAEAREIRN